MAPRCSIPLLGGLVALTLLAGTTSAVALREAAPVRLLVTSVGMAQALPVVDPPAPVPAVTTTPAAPTPRRATVPVPARVAPRPRPTAVPKAPRPPAPRRPAPRLLRRAPAVAPATTRAMGRMRLTAAGYRAWARSVDRSFLSYAQGFVEFDPARVPIEQGVSRVFVWHFTAFYRNAAGPSQQAVGDMAVPPFIEGLAKRGDESGDHVCCGVNWLIDRHGPAHQLAPVNAKLRHNPPYDSVNTGVEVEAARQVDITTAQYESLAYLTVAVLHEQKLLGRHRLSEIVKGHGEMRDAYLLAHPDSHLGSRDDFNAPEAGLLRQRIQAFLDGNPTLSS